MSVDRSYLPENIVAALELLWDYSERNRPRSPDPKKDAHLKDVCDKVFASLYDPAHPFGRMNHGHGMTALFHGEWVNFSFHADCTIQEAMAAFLHWRYWIYQEGRHYIYLLTERLAELDDIGKEDEDKVNPVEYRFVADVLQNDSKWGKV